MRKLLALIFVLVGLTVLFKAGQAVFGWGKAEQVQPVTKQKKPKTKKWKGNGVKLYNMRTPGRKGATITILSTTFHGLNRKHTRLTLKATISQVKAPKWLGPKTFYAYQPQSGRVYRPKVSSRKSGASRQIFVTFPKVPTLSLGPSCSGRNPDPLIMKFPGAPLPKDYRLLLNAPSTPPGHCLGKGFKPPKPKVQLGRIKTTKKKVIVYGRVKNGNYKRVVVQVRGKVKSTAKPHVRKGRFQATFKLPKGKYHVRAGFNGRWDSSNTFRAR